MFDSLELPKDCISEIRGNTLLLTKFNWDYKESLAFQRYANEFVQKNRKSKIYIFCNHPHVFTLGRGNERGVDGLVDFDPDLQRALSYPVEKIERGGGITFHYPGQWIFYPIVNINTNFSLDDLMCTLLKSVQSVLVNDFKIENILAAKKLVGVWKNKSKLASVGIGLRKFVSIHGLALNLIKDQAMFDELKKINPCGLNPTTYTSVDQFVKSSDNLISEFHKQFLTRLEQNDL